MKHKKNLILTALCLFLSFGLCACDSSGSFYSNVISDSDNDDEKTSDSSKKKISDTHSNDGRKVVGISMPSRRLERWNRDGSYLEKSFSEKGYEVILSFADDLIDTQYHDLENMMEQGADILIIAPIDGSSLSAVLDEAEDSNVDIISYDRLLMNSEAVDYYVSFDNYMVGELQGQYIADSLGLDTAGNQKFNFEIASGDTLDNNAKFLFNGMYDVLSPYIESGVLNIVSSQDTFYDTATSSWSTDLARERFVGLLNSYYMDSEHTLNAVACANDSTALGVTEALESEYVGENNVIITGQDCDNNNLRNIIDGKQSMSVYKALANQTVVALALGEALLDGKNPDEKLIEESNFSFECRYDDTTYDNGAIKVKSYLLTPQVITKDNYYENLVETGYYTIGEDSYPVAVE